MVTTGAVRCAKLQSNRHHQQTNSQFFYRPDAFPVAQPTVSKHLKKSSNEEFASEFFQRLIEVGCEPHGALVKS